MSRSDDLVTSVVLPLPLQESWRWFREPARVRAWHGWEYATDGGLDEEIREIYVDGAVVDEDHRSLRLGAHRFRFTEEDGSTRVDVDRGPVPEGEDEAEWERYLPDMDEGWTIFLEQLRFAVTRHPDEPRRTVFLSGTPKDGTISPTQWLGLGQVRLQHAGARYGATVGPGDAITGTVWFVTEHQLGVTVDDWGDGLLVVSDGPRGGPPYTKGLAVLTSYGLDDERLAELGDRWAEWWGRHY